MGEGPPPSPTWPQYRNALAEDLLRAEDPERARELIARTGALFTRRVAEAPGAISHRADERVRPAFESFGQGWLGDEATIALAQKLAPLISTMPAPVERLQNAPADGKSSRGSGAVANPSLPVLGSAADALGVMSRVTCGVLEGGRADQPTLTTQRTNQALAALYEVAEALCAVDDAAAALSKSDAKVSNGAYAVSCRALFFISESIPYTAKGPEADPGRVFTLIDELVDRLDERVNTRERSLLFLDNVREYRPVLVRDVLRGVADDYVTEIQQIRTSADSKRSIALADQLMDSVKLGVRIAESLELAGCTFSLIGRGDALSTPLKEQNTSLVVPGIRDALDIAVEKLPLTHALQVLAFARAEVGAWGPGGRALAQSVVALCERSSDYTAPEIDELIRGALELAGAHPEVAPRLLGAVHRVIDERSNQPDGLQTLDLHRDRGVSFYATAAPAVARAIEIAYGTVQPSAGEYADMPNFACMLIGEFSAQRAVTTPEGRRSLVEASLGLIGCVAAHADGFASMALPRQLADSHRFRSILSAGSGSLDMPSVLRNTLLGYDLVEAAEVSPARTASILGAVAHAAHALCPADSESAERLLKGCLEAADRIVERVGADPDAPSPTEMIRSLVASLGVVADEIARNAGNGVPADRCARMLDQTTKTFCAAMGDAHGAHDGSTLHAALTSAGQISRAAHSLVETARRSPAGGPEKALNAVRSAAARMSTVVPSLTRRGPFRWLLVRQFESVSGKLVRHADTPHAGSAKRTTGPAHVAPLGARVAAKPKQFALLGDVHKLKKAITSSPGPRR